MESARSSELRYKVGTGSLSISCWPPEYHLRSILRLIDSGLVGSTNFRESRRCSRDTHPESYITMHTLVEEDKEEGEGT